MSPSERFLSIREMAERMGVHDRTVRRLLAQPGAPQVTRWGSRVTVREDRFVEWAESRTEPPVTAGTEGGRNPNF